MEVIVFIIAYSKNSKLANSFPKIKEKIVERIKPPNK